MDALIQQINELRTVLEDNPELMSRTSERVDALEGLKVAADAALERLGNPRGSDCAKTEQSTGE